MLNSVQKGKTIEGLGCGVWGLGLQDVGGRILPQTTGELNGKEHGQ